MNEAEILHLLNLMRALDKVQCLEGSLLEGLLRIKHIPQELSPNAAGYTAAAKHIEACAQIARSFAEALEDLSSAMLPRTREQAT